MINVTLEKLEELHEVISKESIVCAECEKRIVSDIANTAGVTH